MSRRVEPHRFAWDGVTRDWRGDQLGCARCPLPPDHQLHHPEPLVPLPADVTAERDRRIGERN